MSAPLSTPRRAPAADPSAPMRAPADALRGAWRAALSVFALAGVTGIGFRMAMASGHTLGLDLTNVRHAHSHLMYFGWATPALMALVALRLPALGGQPVRHAGRIVAATLALALLAFPPFLLSGYQPVAVGGARLPLSVMAAGVNVLAWYAFVWSYERARRNAPASAALGLLDLSRAFLVLATLGAWGLPVLQIVGGEHLALKTALTHLFLDAFSEGWFVFGVLGLAVAEARVDGRRLRVWSAVAALGVPVTFALAMPPMLVPPAVAGLARVGGVLVGVGLLGVVAGVWKAAAPAWRPALALLALKALGQVAGAAWPALAAVAGARVLYLHLMLLGFVTLGLVAAAADAWGERAVPGRSALTAAVGLTLASLVLLTPLGAALGSLGLWTRWLVAAAALGPPLTAAWMSARAR